jgi:hypothetical protein
MARDMIATHVYAGSTPVAHSKNKKEKLMKILSWNSVRSGNVIKFGDDLEIVYDVQHDSKVLQSVSMVSFTYENCSTIVTRKNPFKEVIFPGACEDNECDCRGECKGTEIYSEKFSIDAIKVVADSVKDFIDKKIKKVFYAE